MRHCRWCVTPAVAVLINLIGSCTPPQAGELADRETVDMQINGHEFRAWIADDPAERQQGLMYTTAEEMAPLPDGTERSMLFVFDFDQPFIFEALPLIFRRAGKCDISVAFGHRTCRSRSP